MKKEKEVDALRAGNAVLRERVLAKQQDVGALRRAGPKPGAAAGGRTSWRAFWADPRSSQLGAFHPFRELSALTVQLEAARRHRGAQLLALFPLTRATKYPDPGGVWWAQILRGLSAYYHVDLPFPPDALPSSASLPAHLPNCYHFFLLSLLILLSSSSLSLSSLCAASRATKIIIFSRRSAEIPQTTSRIVMDSLWNSGVI